MVVHFAANRDPYGGRHGNDDPFDHFGVSRLWTAGCIIARGTDQGAFDGVHTVGHRCRVSVARLGAAPTLGSNDIGIVGGCIAAAALGVYNIDRVINAPWIGLPREWPGLSVDFGIPFWTLLPGFLFLGIIISIQTNGAAIAGQHASRRDDRAIDFRRVQGSLAGTGASNLLAGLAGTVPNIINPGGTAFAQITGVASKNSDTSSD